MSIAMFAASPTPAITRRDGSSFDSQTLVVGPKRINHPLTMLGERLERFNLILIVGTPNAEATMSEPTLILQNMRGSCTSDGNTVHALFRFVGRPRRVPSHMISQSVETISSQDVLEAIELLRKT